MKKILWVICLYVASVTANAFEIKQPNMGVKKLAFMVGQWKGKGWIEMRPGQKFEFEQTENIYFKLDKQILMIEGEGRSIEQKNNPSRLIHQAIGIVSFDLQKNNYSMHSYKNDGKQVIAEFKLLSDSQVEWSFAIPHYGYMRYTIEVSDNNIWREIGERSTDGNTWSQFFEMNLEKF